MVAAMAMFSSCNDDTSDDTEVIYGSTQVKSFKLKANTNILSGLDSVFFSIDHTSAQIFNADSLPMGTPLNKMVVQITTDGCSVVELNVPRKNDTDTVINYLTNSTDSIDFSNGPVRLHVVSYDGNSQRDYTVRVNVHTMVPDSLYWASAARRTLPSLLAMPKQQKTVRTADALVCLTSDGSKYDFAVTDNPFDGEWVVSEHNLPFIPNVESLAAAGNTFYMLASDGTLYTSPDTKAWSSTGEKWCHIYGAFGDKILGLKNTDAGYVTVTYPPSTEAAAPDKFPVAATGQLREISSAWTSKKQVVMLGGITADGSLTNALWGFDGDKWARISDKFPKPIANVAIFDYRISHTDTISWAPTQSDVLIAMLGETHGKLNDKVYVSRNAGLDWKEGDDLVQLPSYITPRHSAQALVWSTTATSARSSACQWAEYQPKPLPRWWVPAQPFLPQSRADQPITQWDVPYIYLFGGYDSDGNLKNELWRGVLNRLTFKPRE